jgi:hypothetical protein
MKPIASNLKDLKPSSASPRTIGGVQFRCYKTGISNYCWFDPSGRSRIGSNRGSTYFAVLDGVLLGKRYRSLRSAMLATAAALKK